MKDPGTTKGYGLEPAPLPCGTAFGHGGGPGFLVVAFDSADGSRQVTLSITPFSGDHHQAAMTLLTSAVCP